MRRTSSFWKNTPHRTFKDVMTTQRVTQTSQLTLPQDVAGKTVLIERISDEGIHIWIKHDRSRHKGELNPTWQTTIQHTCIQTAN